MHFWQTEKKVENRQKKEPKWGSEKEIKENESSKSSGFGLKDINFVCFRISHFHSKAPKAFILHVR